MWVKNYKIGLTWMRCSSRTLKVSCISLIFNSTLSVVDWIEFMVLMTILKSDNCLMLRSRLRRSSCGGVWHVRRMKVKGITSMFENLRKVWRGKVALISWHRMTQKGNSREGNFHKCCHVLCKTILTKKFEFTSWSRFHHSISVFKMICLP